MSDHYQDFNLINCSIKCHINEKIYNFVKNISMVFFLLFILHILGEGRRKHVTYLGQLVLHYIRESSQYLVIGRNSQRQMTLTHLQSPELFPYCSWWWWGGAQSMVSQLNQYQSHFLSWLIMARSFKVMCHCYCHHITTIASITLCNILHIEQLKWSNFISVNLVLF